MHFYGAGDSRNLQYRSLQGSPNDLIAYSPANVRVLSLMYFTTARGAGSIAAWI